MLGGLSYLAEVGQAVTRELHRAVHQVPADAGDHLSAPRVKQARNVDGGTRGGPAEHAVLLHQQRPRTQLRCLNGRDRPRRAAPDDGNVVAQPRSPSISRFVGSLPCQSNALATRPPHWIRCVHGSRSSPAARARSGPRSPKHCKRQHIVPSSSTATRTSPATWGPRRQPGPPQPRCSGATGVAPDRGSEVLPVLLEVRGSAVLRSRESP